MLSAYLRFSSVELGRGVCAGTATAVLVLVLGLVVVLLLLVPVLVLGLLVLDPFREDWSLPELGRTSRTRSRAPRSCLAVFSDTGRFDIVPRMTCNTNESYTRSSQGRHQPVLKSVGPLPGNEVRDEIKCATLTHKGPYEFLCEYCVL